MEERLKINIGYIRSLEDIWGDWRYLDTNENIEDYITIEEQQITIKNLEIVAYEELRYWGHQNLKFVNVKIKSIDLYQLSHNMCFHGCELDFLSISDLESIEIFDSKLKTCQLSRVKNCSIQIDESLFGTNSLETLEISSVDSLDLKIKNASPKRIEVNSSNGKSLTIQNISAKQIILKDCKFKKATINDSSSEFRIDKSEFAILGMYRNEGSIEVYDNTLTSGKINQCKKADIKFKNNIIQNDFRLLKNSKLEIEKQNFEKVELLNNEGHLTISIPKNYSLIDLQHNQIAEISIEGIYDSETEWKIIPSEESSLEIKDCHVKEGDLRVESKVLNTFKFINSSCSLLKIINKQAMNLILTDNTLGHFELTSDFIGDLKLASTTFNSQKSINTIRIGESHNMILEKITMVSPVHFDVTHCDNFYFRESELNDLVLEIDSGQVHIQKTITNSCRIQGETLDRLTIQALTTSGTTNIDFETVSSLCLRNISILNDTSTLPEAKIKIQSCLKSLIKGFKTKGLIDLTIQSGNKLLLGNCTIHTLTINGVFSKATHLINSTIDQISFSGEAEKFKIINIHSADASHGQFKIINNKGKHIIIEESKTGEITLMGKGFELFNIVRNAFIGLYIEGNANFINVSSNLEKKWSCSLKQLIATDVEFNHNSMRELIIYEESQLETIRLINVGKSKPKEDVDEFGFITDLKLDKLTVINSNILHLITIYCCIGKLKVEKSSLPDMNISVVNEESEILESFRDNWNLIFPFNINAQFIDCNLENISISSVEGYKDSKVILSHNCHVSGTFQASNLDGIEMEIIDTNIQKLCLAQSETRLKSDWSEIETIDLKSLKASTIHLIEFSATDVNIENSEIGTFHWARSHDGDSETIHINQTNFGFCHIQNLSCNSIAFINSSAQSFSLDYLLAQNLKLNSFKFIGNNEVDQKFQMNFINTDIEKADELTFINTDLSLLKLNSCYFKTFESLEIKSSKVDEISCTATTWPMKVVSYDDKDELHQFEIKEACRQLKLAMANHQDRVSELQFHALEMKAHRKIIKESPRDYQGIIDRVSLLGGLTNSFGMDWIKPVGLMVLFISIFHFIFFCLFYERIPNWDFLCTHWNWVDYFSFYNPTHRVSQFSLTGPIPGWAAFVDFLSKIFSAFFIYQIVAAFRKFRK